MKANPARTLYEVLPTTKADRKAVQDAALATARVGVEVPPCTAPWKVTRNGERMAVFPRKFGRGGALEFAVTVCNAAWNTQRQHSSLKIKGQRGRIIEERTYPRSSDPTDTKG